MANNNCQACEDLKEYAPDFVQNGVTDEVCASLQNDTGFNPALSVQHNDCEDLTDANDCLIGSMDDEIDSYEVCDWKTYMHELVPNIYNVLGAIICAICGLWTNIHNIWERIDCVYNGLKKLTQQLSNSTTYEPQVFYARSNLIMDTNYYHSKASEEVINFTNIKAPYDCVAIVTMCADVQRNNGKCGEYITLYHSGEAWTVNMERERAQHFECWDRAFSTTIAGSVKMKKGTYLRCKTNPFDLSGAGRFRVHQFAVTLIPTFSTGSINANNILGC